MQVLLVVVMQLDGCSQNLALNSTLEAGPFVALVAVASGHGSPQSVERRCGESLALLEQEDGRDRPGRKTWTVELSWHLTPVWGHEAQLVF